MAVSADSTAGSSSLRTKLATVLPAGCHFRFHHLSTPPLQTDALYSAPPDERPDRTYCEKHFLTVSVKANAASASSDSQAGLAPKHVLVLGLEIFVYTTAYVTTLFVSKADSTGFLCLLGLAPGTPSPIRQVCAGFIGHLVETRRRRGVQLVVSLFARAQDQYLFPGSVKHSGKHVLDDRGLVKWWCSVLDPLLTSSPVGDAAPPWRSVKGYLVIPGLDAHETRAFIPRSSAAASSWFLGHPLERISHYYREFDWVPPRCLIPRFPDDPKSRFRDELDEEAAQSGSMQTLGTWKSVKTLDTFWEVMGFRQECSSGRMTGFIWIVFDDNADRTEAPRGTAESALEPPETPLKKRTSVDVTPNTTPRKLFPSKADSAAREPPKSTSDKKKGKKQKKQLKGQITSRRPRVKTEQRNYLLDRPTSSKYYFWPPEGRGERIVDESGYRRTVELLLHLDFATLDKATGSSRRWISEAGTGSLWGLEVTGTREPSSFSQDSAAGQTSTQANNLSGLVKRKRTDTTESGTRPVKGWETNKSGAEQGQEKQPAVNTLGSGLVRKKPKA
ncbi:histone acetylation protein [Hirsutella rhossiliensis]|uniref:histone acetyltransferase n=1 Tax=Hirsutella rhossiliensis TaxID=111463 RepID=A0A9P8MQ01_9HYPO|nr:histone acetylation protein [Hirsutella rhossiliensis]KAH0957102.1 histone acetylation protein [Hirsutella rhossiliensis]